MPDSHYPAIGDYAVIGDSRSVALVARSGSIDWWCLPRFDGDPVFARLLDADQGGYFEITPALEFEASREYLHDTNILVTQFRTRQGVLQVTDFMPALTEEQKRTNPVPFRCIVRRIKGLSGNVPLRVALRVRADYCRRTASPRRLRENRYAIEWQSKAMHLSTAAVLKLEPEQISADLQIAEGEQYDFVLSFSEEAPADLVMLDQLDVLQRLSEQYWRAWATGCQYSGRYRDQVMRSALTLKLLSYAPSGAIIAAPTTSLPELIGGARNWDYRYCWLRDAGFTVRALLRVGNPQEAHAFAEWLLYATRLTHPELQVMYTLYGEYRIPERTLDYLDGYQHSRPVRVGNEAARQFQLDIYGEVADALVQYVRSGGSFDRDAQRMVRGIADVIMQRWQEPDFGIWEFRSGKRHNTHSKIMAWVGLQRCLELAKDYRRLRPIMDYTHVRDQIFNWVIENGFNRKLGHFVASPMRDLDAALLVIPLVGFLPAHDQRVAATVQAIRRTLAVDDLVYRYKSPDGLPGGEGAFLICSFWLVEALARMGNTDEAHELFERLLERCNDVGLLAEQIEPSTGAQLGNFPQALSHIGLMNAALTLEEVRRGTPRVSLRAAPLR